MLIQNLFFQYAAPSNFFFSFIFVLVVCVPIQYLAKKTTKFFGLLRAEELKQKPPTLFVSLLQLELNAWSAVSFHYALEDTNAAEYILLCCLELA